MENKINIAELLKDCPKGMELDCLMYEDVYFDFVDELNIIHCYIQHETHKTSLTFNQHGTPNSDIKSKCIIFPKGKTTWEGFVPPCKFKDGDILVSGLKSCEGNPFIFKQINGFGNAKCYCAINCYGELIFNSDNWSSIKGCRLANEEEKAKLFQAIKDNGYKWDEETKTLGKLPEPKFKVGDKVLWNYNTEKIIKTISHVQLTENRGYVYWIYSEGSSSGWGREDELTPIPNKFDIATLKPFESKVLVRHNKDNKWCGSFFSHIDKDLHSNCYKFVTIAGKSYPMMIPYEGNEHLLGTTDDCDEYLKTW